MPRRLQQSRHNLQTNHWVGVRIFKTRALRELLNLLCSKEITRSRLIMRSAPRRPRPMTPNYGFFSATPQGSLESTRNRLMPTIEAFALPLQQSTDSLD